MTSVSAEPTTTTLATAAVDNITGELRILVVTDFSIKAGLGLFSTTGVPELEVGGDGDGGGAIIEIRAKLVLFKNYSLTMSSSAPESIIRLLKEKVTVGSEFNSGSNSKKNSAV